MWAIRVASWCVVVTLLSLVPCKSVSAAVVSGFSGTSIPIPGVNYQGTGPQVFGPGITWKAARDYALFGYTAGYGFGSNGSWNGGVMGPMIGTNSGTEPMTLELSTPVSAIGGFVNYAPGYAPAVISVYDSSYTLIESTTLTFLTGGGVSSGQFIGFKESTPTIQYLTLGGGYIALTDLKVAVATPEPSTVVLTLTGAALAGVVGIRRRWKMSVK